MTVTQQQRFGLDPSLLVMCQGGHMLQTEVCMAFKALQQAALKDNVDCQIASAYRSFEQQFAIWQKKWNGDRALLDINEVPLDFARLSDEQKLHAILTWSALPGTSRHHWGTDLDVYDKHSIESSGHPLQLIQTEYLNKQGPCFKLNNWLNQFAADFGFYRPYQHYVGGVASEPWHLSYQTLATTMQSSFNTEQLCHLLDEYKLAGVHLVKKHIKQIYTQYVLNKGSIVS